MKILPVLRCVIPFVTADDAGEVTVHRLPLQVFRGGSGGTIVRIGDNALFFEESGKFDGFESALPSYEAAVVAYAEASEESQATRGMPPAKAYYQPGTTGHTAETRSWPRGDAASRAVEPSDPYVVVASTDRKRRN